MLAQGPKDRGLVWVEGWYGMYNEKCHIISYLSYTDGGQKYSYDSNIHYIFHIFLKITLKSIHFWFW